MTAPQIPEDLAPLYELANSHRAWIRSAYDHISEDGARVSMWELPVLIERIAALTAENARLKAPVSDKELSDNHFPNSRSSTFASSLAAVNRLLASRAAEPGSCALEKQSE